MGTKKTNGPLPIAYRRAIRQLIDEHGAVDAGRLLGSNQKSAQRGADGLSLRDATRTTLISGVERLRRAAPEQAQAAPSAAPRPVSSPILDALLDAVAREGSGDEAQAHAVRRIERKLDALLLAWGIDPEEVTS